MGWIHCWVLRREQKRCVWLENNYGAKGAIWLQEKWGTVWLRRKIRSCLAKREIRIRLAKKRNKD